MAGLTRAVLLPQAGKPLPPKLPVPQALPVPPCCRDHAWALPVLRGAHPVRRAQVLPGRSVLPGSLPVPP